MAQSISEQSPLLPKPTLRCTVSRRSFAISRRPTVHHLRRKLKSVRTFAAKVVPRRSSTAPSGTDYFTTRLPAEIRLKIYAYVLHSDVPLKLTPNARRAVRPRNLDILHVSRLVNAEAVQALYEHNTVSTDRASFCTHVANATKPGVHGSLNHDMIRSLYITSLAPSPPCAALQAKPTWPAPSKALVCVYCDTCLLPLIRSLRAMPRLRKAFIDYHNQPTSIPKLHTTLTGTYGQTTSLRLTCIGVGKYTLTGPWFTTNHTTIELRNVFLAETWTRMLALPKLNIANVLGYYRDMRTGSKAIFETLAPRFGKRDVKVMMRRLLSLMSFHDHGMVPRGLEEIWPADLEMEFEVLEGLRVKRAEFLHKFNVEVERLCAEGVGMGDLVKRRGAEDAMW